MHSSDVEQRAEQFARSAHVESAKRIAAECRGVSEFLDTKFGESYRAARKKLKSQRAT